MTGPVMAKAVEDTLFYRFNRLIGLNEVAGNPAATAGGLERFHDEMKRRRKEQPHGLSAATTHDTKRGEDARARLLVLAEIPDLFAEAVARWRALNRDGVRDLDGGPAPEPAVEWLLYQALIGVWPASLEPSDQAGLETLRARFLPYVEKALREAKLRTDWLAVDEAYEAAVKVYAERLLSADNAAFLDGFHHFLLPVIAAGRHNGLVATVVRLTAPGIPDIYQGSEGGDFSLADPDNRRPVDFETLHAALEDDASQLVLDKLRVTRELLALRGETGDLFTAGEYIPVEAEGPAARNAVAFLRRDGDRIALTVALRLPVALMSMGADAAENTRLVLGGHGHDRQWHDVFAATAATLGDETSIGSLLKGRPAAVFLSPPRET
jgi:(1->4)-alpha-D-glucan 1-alpha-D-glucosylmutase